MLSFHMIATLYVLPVFLCIFISRTDTKEIPHEILFLMIYTPGSRPVSSIVDPHFFFNIICLDPACSVRLFFC